MPDWKQYVRQNLHLENLHPEREAEIVDDLAQQLEDAYRDGLLRGLTEDKAAAFARQHICDWQALSDQLAQSRTGALDSLELLQRRVDDSRSRTGWSSRFARLPQDLFFALRMMRKNPLFTAVAVVTLALGIGANTAMFSVLNALLLRIVPARDSQELVSLRWSSQAMKIRSHSSYGDCRANGISSDQGSCSFSLPFFHDLQQQPGRPFSGVAGFAQAPRLALSGNGNAGIVRGQLVSGDYFSTLGVQAAGGRLIAPADETNKSSVVVLSYAYWQNAFGGSASAIGKTILLNSVPFMIIGIAEPRFKNLALSTPEDLWVPLPSYAQLVPNFDPRELEANSFWVEIVGRLREGVSRQQAKAAVSLFFRNEVIHGDKPLSKESDHPSVELVPLPQALGPGPDKLAPVYVLALAVGLILLIACANVAGLLLARATARRKEIAVRVAVGAARGHIISQLLTESLLLSVLGGTFGVIFAIWALHAMMDMISRGGEMPLPFTPTIDLRVLAFTAAVSIVTGIVFGIAPALRATRVDLNTAMKQNDGASSGSERRRWFNFGNVLVAIQVSLAIVLLIGAGLLVRTLKSLERVNPGFDTNNLLIFGVDARLAGYKDVQVDDLHRNLQQKLSAIAGVTKVSYSWRPLLKGSLWTHDLHLPGTPADKRVDSDYMAVGPGFFSTMEIPLLAGHDFNDSEFAMARTIALQVAQHRQDPPPTQLMPVIVNRKFADLYLKGAAKALNQQFGYENTPDEKSFGYEVVGIASDAKYNSLRRDIHPTMYIPTAINAVYFELRTALDSESLVPSVRSTVASVDRALPIFDVRTQMQQIDEQLVSERTLAKFSGLFGLQALLLASIGLYGLLAYEVAQRTREVGVRMALGARRSDVIASILQRGLLLVAVGAIAGTALGLVLVRLTRTLLYGVRVVDPPTLASVTALLLTVALAACIVPAWRAAKVDPMVSLRCE